ncbi:MAG TPA: ATP-dependent DNA ligase [Euryarchaeota archaeon]|nr:putative DNA ligase-like protein/MT0965 [archaeon BMS3Bbin16]HDH28408.1 ATP-dependent DNA ligase [Euryarchaeota archaeon]
MDYSVLAGVYERLIANPSKLEKTAILAEFLSGAPASLLEILPHLITGDIFSEWDRELGVGPGLLYSAVAFVSGVNKKELENSIRVHGDTGLAVREIFERKPQTTLFSEKLTVEGVYESFTKIAAASGKGAQNKKTKILSDLLSNAEPVEAMYLVRTVLSELRIGVAEGLLRDAIASAFDVEKSVVERAIMLTNNMGLVAKTAYESGAEGLARLTVQVGRPLRPMLAQSMPSLEEAIKGAGRAAIEVKYDGARVQIHKKGGEIRIFSRRLEEVTNALPDVVSAAKKAITAGDVILDGETVAVDPVTRRPKPFQDILRRFRRKYGVEEKAVEIPFETYIFDLLYADGELLIDETLEVRRERLASIVKAETKKFMLADQLITNNLEEALSFYNRALEAGHEGVMVKNLDSTYVIGSRVGYMYKVKPIAETLDLVILGAVWGEGKRAGWLSSYYLGARDELGEFREVGRVATGVSEQQLADYTELLRPYIEYTDGLEVRLMPKVVVEVGYQEIQKSPKYDSGFALRFPRVIRLRDDKSIEEVDTLERMEELYKKQGHPAS